MMQDSSQANIQLERMNNPSVDLETSFMGLKMNSPVIAGSSPLNINPETIRMLVTAGVGAIVLPSILQEQLIYQSIVKSSPLNAIEQSGYAPQQDDYNGGPVQYLETIKKVKSAFSIPLIASIHGASPGEWLDYASKIQDAGADALEVNWQIGRCDPNESGDQIEARMLHWLSQIRARVTIPIAFKMNARFTNPASIAMRLQNEGINGLVLFAHHPRWDVDIDRLHWTIGWELTPTTSLGKTLEGIVETRSKNLHVPIAASGGVRTGEDAIKAMVAGAEVVMIVSELYRQGPNAVKDILAGIQRYLDSHQHSSIGAFRNSLPCFDHRPSFLMRAEIIDPLTSTSKYSDPTPVAKELSGDCFGHPSS